MQAQNKLYFTNSTVLYPLAFVVAIWIVFWAEVRFGWNLKYYGIYPQRVEGLRGIIFGPFIHGSLSHLFNNSIPLFVLSSALFYFYRSIKWKVLLIGILVTGVLTWWIGRPAYHIGASGVVYLLAAFLFFKGIFSKQYQLTALAFVVVFLYGSLLWYVFPIDPKISWEGHLSGFLVGIALSLIFWKNPIEAKKYVWERADYDPQEDEFLKHFDEDGNFIETRPETPEEPVEARKSFKIRYQYKSNSDRDDRK
ncbi:rhomboid family intramembrane serine protease [Constantimarinum furrinae]|uniref:Membrane protein n=1 Tax=Constantimarinum furrinae TaxID=2562285 RepID=A0A7G8PUL0_9FLAO|nr:rhomboid family intramembrane serine protease [Constantimarinum furrinae]QNJ98026.1 membrane protein [Constantimarinum furrinae]